MTTPVKETFLSELQNVIQRLDQAQEQRLVVISTECNDLQDLALQMHEEAISRQKIREIHTLALKVLEKAGEHLALARQENLIIKAAIQDTHFLHDKIKESLVSETKEKDEEALRMVELEKRKLQTKYPGYKVSVRLEKVDGEYILIPEVMF